MKKKLTLLFILISYWSFGQLDSLAILQKEVQLIDNTLQIDSISISPYYFKLTDLQGQEIAKTAYTVDFSQATLHFKKPPLAQNYIVYYKALPEFLTKTYQSYDPKIILQETHIDSTFISTKNLKKEAIPFDGLTTKGTFARGITVGNNQDMVVNSALDLQISGLIKDGVRLKAVLRDDNLPRQQIGYSENIKEFDEVYIELNAKNWLARGGDLTLKDNNYYSTFSKKVQGVLIDYHSKKTQIQGAGALVKGQYGNYTFQGQEANQGPYKIKGKNDEVYLLLVTDSEKVYVNGILLSRGIDKDYRIDYQNAEIMFNPTFAISSKDRISIEYQYTDRSYTRLISYAKTAFQADKWVFSSSFYNESDAKNNPLQQELSDTQKQYLAAAGDNPLLMNAPSAVASAYSENKILYKKVSIGTGFYYEFSTNANDELYFVRFTDVGASNGSYIIQSSNAIGTIYTYVGAANGSFDPVVKLVAPNKLQLINLQASYTPNDKTALRFDTAFSNYDKNLFSNTDDTDNKANAFKIQLKQQLLTKKWRLWTKASFEQIATDFKAIERLKNIDFNYKWNTTNSFGKQQFLKAGIYSKKTTENYFNYEIQQLQIGENTKGINHVINGKQNYKNWFLTLNATTLASENTLENNKYSNVKSALAYKRTKTQYKLSYQAENTVREDKNTALLNPLSRSFEATKMEVQWGKSNVKNNYLAYEYIVTDSIHNNTLTPKSNTHSYSIKSLLLQSKQGSATVFVNYRKTKLLADNRYINALNSKVDFKYNLYAKTIQWHSKMETFSGKLAQQEFTYIEAEQGLGYYKWNDYNGNNIQELHEFEVAQFQDEARYIRVLLPTKNYINTFQNKFSQSLIINPIKWADTKQKSLNFLAKFYNQTNLIIDTKNRQIDNQFELNPFKKTTLNTLGLIYTLQNKLYFNRAKQHYSFQYEYLDNQNRTLLSIGLQEQYNTSNALYFQHRLKKYWLLELTGKQQNSKHFAENYIQSNYNTNTQFFEPKISYQLTKNTNFTAYYSLKNSQNTIGNQEELAQKRIGIKLQHSSKNQFSVNLMIDLYTNDFVGNANSPIAYQMLAGLQKGKNQVWQILLHKKLNSFMDLNINYSGRKSTSSTSIHNGTIQLKAYF